MPDGTAPNFVYRRAVRGRFSPLIMLSGPSGTGKTFSALRLATGIAGPDGKICVADTDRGRARLYAGKFTFEHLDLEEPFRPKLFEDAAIAAQKQGASVLVIDNFAHEWTALLEWHEAEIDRLSKGDYQRRDAMKMVAWGIVKPPHKHMLHTLYRLNMPIVLCTAAEHKIAMVEQIDNGGRKKTVPVDRGLLPIGDKDTAFAMTLSLMFEDPARPGIARPVKALLDDLKPLLNLEKPLDEETGARIAAWARGEVAGSGQPVAGSGRPSNEGEKSEAPSPSPPLTQDEPPPDLPPEPPPPESPPESGRRKRQVPEAEIVAGADKLEAAFDATRNRAEHLALVDDADNRRQIEWLKKNRPDLHRAVEGALRASWKRTDPQTQPKEQTGMAV